MKVGVGVKGYFVRLYCIVLWEHCEDGALLFSEWGRLWASFRGFYFSRGTYFSEV